MGLETFGEFPQGICTRLSVSDTGIVMLMFYFSHIALTGLVDHRVDIG